MTAPGSGGTVPFPLGRNRGNVSGRRGFVVLNLLALSTLLITGCAAGSEQLPAAITCTTQYRPDYGSSAGEEAAQLVLPRVDGPAATRQDLSTGTFRLSGSYVGAAPDGRAVSLSIGNAEGQLLASMLYQLEDGSSLASRFSGGHGFTGLHYVRDGEAELQLYCEAGE
ncbi:hypothetical protein [Arthrobacter sp. NPDC089319]|uniref:hypothetical protein n=1 Tax=Arthrobacter sp. NPDC089319 TaxID=3155915 RepID=UPI0034314230